MSGITNATRREYPSDIAFSPAVKSIQKQKGSRGSYARMERGEGWQTTVTPDLEEFLADLDMFYLGTANNELEHITAERKILIVIGDGADTDNEAARDSMPDLGVRARQDHIETYAISMKSEISPDTRVIQDMIESARVVTNHDGIAPEVAAIARRMTEREAFAFSADQLAWNGLRHDLVLACPGMRVETTVELPQWAPPPKHVSTSRLPGLLLVAGVATLVIALIARRARR